MESFVALLFEAVVVVVVVVAVAVVGGGVDVGAGVFVGPQFPAVALVSSLIPLVLALLCGSTVPFKLLVVLLMLLFPSGLLLVVGVEVDVDVVVVVLFKQLGTGDGLAHVDVSL